MIRAIVLDFDGLILDTESALIAAYGDVHTAHGQVFDRTGLLRAVGHSELAFDPWHAFGPGADRAALEAERRTRNQVRDLELAVLPGVVALLDDARRLDVRVGLASLSSRAHCTRHLARRGLLERFGFLACHGETPLPKPAPDLYKHVLEHFRLRGIEAIAFEDSHTGSLAAKRANLWCVAAPGPTTADHDFRHVDRQVRSLADCRLADLMAEFTP